MDTKYTAGSSPSSSVSFYAHLILPPNLWPPFQLLDRIMRYRQPIGRSGSREWSPLRTYPSVRGSISSFPSLTRLGGELRMVGFVAKGN